MRKLLCLLQEGFFALWSYKNAWVYLADRFGILKTQEATLSLYNGIRYRFHPNTTDIRVINEVWNVGVYDALLHFIVPGATVVDIGANIGAFSIKAARRASSVRVISYEPFPDNFDILKKNIALNRLENFVVSHKKAVAGTRGSFTFYFRAGDTGGGSLYQHDASPLHHKLTVDTITLEDVFNENNITRCAFLKMDCEGAETEIILHAPRHIFERIASMSIEWHKDHSRYTVDDFLGYVKNLGYTTAFDNLTGTITAYRNE